MNKVILKGRITKELELKELNNDKKVINFNVAVRRDYKNQNGEYESDFFNCSAFGNTANFLLHFFSKGQEILLIGHLQNRSWETESGEKRFSTDIIVESVDFCGNKKIESNTSAEIPSQFTQTTNDFSKDISSDDLPF